MLRLSFPPADFLTHPTISSAIAQLFPRRHLRRSKAPSEWLETLLSAPSETARFKAASDLSERFRLADDDGKVAFFALLTSHYNADADVLDQAIARYRRRRDAASLAALHAASEPRRWEVIRQLEVLPDGLAGLIEMRDHALRLSKRICDFADLDRDFIRFLTSRFSSSFLQLRQLDFRASAELMSKLMRYEAVHAIDNWQSLRARLDPPDRRCYAFFHPRLGDDPLIFVEIALMREIPRSIDSILRVDRPFIDAQAAKTAVFYSISNCQQGLRGIPFGGMLLKQVVEILSSEFPSLKTFVTLSPIPGLTRWLRDNPSLRLATFNLNSGDYEDEAARRELLSLSALYLTSTTDTWGDPVARFHLGNGAKIERLNWMADTSDNAMRQSRGMMVNYRYDADRIERNRSAFANREASPASPEIRRLAQLARRRGSASSI